MDRLLTKRDLHHLWTRIRPFKTCYFLILACICALICVMGLRNNYKTMVVLRQAVYVADQGKDDQSGNVEDALQQLRAYVGQHMNTDLATSDGVYPPIQLVHTYERLQKAEKARVDALNAKVYTDAQTHCEALHPGSFSGGPRVPCIEEYVKSHTTSIKKIPDAVYKFDFVSPGWSPDLAGWSMAAGILFATLAVTRFILGKVLP